MQLTGAALATIFHDMRTPLMAITGALSVMEACFDDGLPPHGQRAYDAGIRATEALNGMLTDFELRLRDASVTAEEPVPATGPGLSATSGEPSCDP